MDLNRISIRPRLRTGWEAIDLGFIMAITWWRHLFLSWIIPSLSLYFILLIFLHEHLGIAILIIWWLKPLWDRAPLYIASRALFGEEVTAMQAIRHLPKLMRKDLLQSLSYRRFSITRSFDLPVTILENLQSKERSKRLMVLHRKLGGSAAWLTIACVHLESIIAMGCIGFVFMFIPEEFDIELFDIDSNMEILSSGIVYLLSLLSMAFAAPFYTMAGFALYISRRVDLEAWDIEIRFRNLANRYALKMKSSSTSLLLVIPLTLCQGTMLFADDSPNANATEFNHETSTILIEEITEGTEFHKFKTYHGWRLKKQEKENDDDETLPSWFLKLLDFFDTYLIDKDKEDDKSFSVNELFAMLIEVLLWGVGIALISVIAYKYRKQIQNLAASMQQKKEIPKELPAVLFGLDIRKESLPNDVPRQVMKLWENNQHREALGLLYRSSLSKLVHQHSFLFNDGHTEKECADIVQQSGPVALTTYISKLTRTWQHLAYAHHLPLTEDIDDLCLEWPRIFPDEP